MGKRTIKKKRNTRKRNSFKRKKNTLKKYTLKRKKINLRKLGGSPRAGPPRAEPLRAEPPRAEPPIEDIHSSSSNLSNLTELGYKINREDIKTEWNRFMENPASQTPIADTLFDNSDILVNKNYTERMIEILKERKSRDDAKYLQNLYEQYQESPADKNKRLNLERYLEYYDTREEYLDWLNNEKSSYFKRSLLCKPPMNIYEEGTMKILLEQLRGGDKKMV